MNLKKGITRVIFEGKLLKRENVRLRERIKTLTQELEKKEFLLNERLESANKELRKKVFDLQRLLNKAREFNTPLEFNQLLNSFLLIIMGHLRCNNVSLLLREGEEGQEFMIRNYKGIPVEKIEGLRLKDSSELVKLLKTRSRPLVLEDYSDDPLLESEREKLATMECAICAPLKIKGELRGIVTLGHKINGKPFYSSDLDYLAVLINQVSVAIENAYLIKKLQDKYTTILDILVSIIESKDYQTKGHSQRVRHYARVIARELGYGEEELEALELGALFHDIGKIAISDHLLLKEGSFEESDRKEMCSHTGKGASILMNFIPEAVDFVLHHHERYDGSGYPDGLKGEEISLGARIVAVAEAFDSMISASSSRKALSRKEAIEELKKCSGTQFDPKIVKIFIRLSESGIFAELEGKREESELLQKLETMVLKKRDEAQ